MRRAGRPRGPGQGQNQEVNELAALIQGQLDSAGMSGRELHRALKESGYAERYPLPSHATLQRRINGEHLANYRHLVDAIIDICTPAAQVKSVRERTDALHRKAWQAPTPIPPGHDVSEVALLRARVDYLTQLQETQRQLTLEGLYTSADQKRSASQAATLIWLLAAAGNRRNGGNTVGDTSTQHELRRMERERDDARKSLAEALLRIRSLEENLAPAPTADRAPETVIEPRADTELADLHAELLRLDPTGSRFANTLRRAMDSILDGSRTGRFSWDQLTKSEKTMLGTRIGLEVRREFRFSEGRTFDFAFGGAEFDLKFSMRLGSWMFHDGLVGRVVLLITVADESSTWSAGLIRLEPQLLREGRNRDSKTILNETGRAAIRWLHHDQPLPENVLVHLSAFDIDAIFSGTTPQQRVNELLRRAQWKLISRNVVATVAMQDDAARRVRQARPKLAQEGIIVLSGSSPRDVDTARRMGLPVPTRGQWVSATE